MQTVFIPNLVKLKFLKSELEAAFVSHFFSRISQSACCVFIAFKVWLSYCCACKLALFKDLPIN